MFSKILTLSTILVMAQNIDSKGFNLFLGSNIPGTQTTNPAFLPQISQLQLRLSALSASTNSKVGSLVGLGLRDVNVATTGIKNDIKLLINSIESNPLVTKDCINENAFVINNLKSVANSQTSFCKKDSRTRILSMNQVHKEASQQIFSLYNEIFATVNECTLWKPNNTTECFTSKSSVIQKDISELESEINQILNAVEISVYSLIDHTKNCLGQVLNQLQLEVDDLTNQLQQCSVTK